MTPVLSTVLLRTQSDERLVTLAAAGHERAFEVIAARHRPALMRALRRILPPARVDDALQQTFLSAWTALTAGTEVRALVPWLHRIARNAAVTALGHTGYDHAELEASLRVTPGPEEDLERRDVMRRTLRGLAALPPRQRDALLAVAVEGRPHAEVAAELGVSETAVRQLVHRARTSLRTAVGALVPTPLITWALTAGHAATAGEGMAGAALGAGGTSAIATALKITAVVAVVSTPVVQHAATVHHRQSPQRSARVAAAHGAQSPAGTSRAVAVGRAGAGATVAAGLARSTGAAASHRAHAQTLPASHGRGGHLPSAAAATTSAGTTAIATPTASPAPTAAAPTATTPSPTGSPAPGPGARWLALLRQRRTALLARRTAAAHTTHAGGVAAATTPRTPSRWPGHHGSAQAPPSLPPTRDPAPAATAPTPSTPTTPATPAPTPASGAGTGADDPGTDTPGPTTPGPAAPGSSPPG